MENGKMDNPTHTRALIRQELLRIRSELHSRQGKVVWHTERAWSEAERAAYVRRMKFALVAVSVLIVASGAVMVLLRVMSGEPFWLMAMAAGVCLVFNVYSMPKALDRIRQRTHENLRLELDMRRQKLTVSDMAGRQTVYRFHQQDVLLPPFPIAATEADLQRLAAEVQGEISRISGLAFAAVVHQAT